MRPNETLTQRAAGRALRTLYFPLPPTHGDSMLSRDGYPVYDLHRGGNCDLGTARCVAWKRSPHYAHCYFEPTDAFFRAVHKAGWGWDDGRPRLYTFFDTPGWDMARNHVWIRQTDAGLKSQRMLYRRADRGGVVRVERLLMTPDDEDAMHGAYGEVRPFAVFPAVRHYLIGACDARVDVVLPARGAPFVVGCVRDRVPPPLFDRLKLSPMVYAHALGQADPAYPWILPATPDRATYTAWLRRP